MKYDIDSFYKNMQSILKEKNIANKEIYSAIGMSQGNYSNAINRKNGKQFSAEQMLKIADYLDVSLDEMFSTKEMHTDTQYYQIPGRNRWTYADLLRILFAIRKSGIEFDFENVELNCPEKMIDHVPMTALVISERLNIAGCFSFMNSNSDMEINNILCEWSNIISCTRNIEKEARELMITAWEDGIINQVKEIVIDPNSHVEYKRDENTKEYHVFIREPINNM
ncbi:MAG: helix-turn-helix transcriptional regulator [Lachnospiraceae bacterium]|nr:helix-turn-helix transcriptional regulator [Lachnospiraceae bacterium]